jgi:Cys-tRNA(Pro)/Cys-tRNA(Cys) deacylase
MMEKTNALRILDKAKIAYSLHSYDSDGIALDATEVSRRIQKSTDMVYKTLLVVGASKRVIVLVINGADEVDLKKAAIVFNEKNLEMIPVASLLSISGYVRGGCSPVGMKKLFPTYFDEKILSLDKVIVSAGRIGLQMELDPKILISSVNGKVADLVKTRQLSQ